jgi:hypothetical protein
MGAIKKLAGPAYVASSATNIYVPSSALIYATIRHIRLVNKDSAARTVTLYIGATGGSAGGTEILKDWSIAVAGEKDLYFPAGIKVLSTDFLTGIASSASAVTVLVMGEEHVV